MANDRFSLPHPPASLYGPKRLLAVLCCLTGLLLSITTMTATASTAAASEQNLTRIHWCVFDVLGAAGPAKQMVDDYKIRALRWGIELSTEYYKDEQEASAQFDAGHCDLINLPDFRARKYNHFTGSINAVGAIPDEKHLGQVIQSLAQTEAQPLMRSGEYEIMGIVFIGGLHAFVTDRAMTRPEALVGRRISILEGIEESDYLIEQNGMIAVETDLAGMFHQFNTKQVDYTVAPLIVYEGLELYQGLEPNGGISRYPFAMATMQLVGRWENFPEDAGQKSREFVADSHLSIVITIRDYEEPVPDKYWFDIPLQDFYHWDNVFTRARNDLAAAGIYNPKMLKLLKKVRCKSFPDRAECTEAATKVF